MFVIVLSSQGFNVCIC